MMLGIGIHQHAAANFLRSVENNFELENDLFLYLSDGNGKMS